MYVLIYGLIPSTVLVSILLVVRWNHRNDGLEQGTGTCSTIPREDDLLEAEMYLAMQEYWDDLGSYWSDSSVEKKIIMMGRFLIHGGKLEDVIDRYKDGISEDRIRGVRPCIFRYLGVLMANGHINRHSPLYAELDSLSDNELIAKLSEKIIQSVKETEGRDANGKLCYNYEIVV